MYKCCLLASPLRHFIEECTPQTPELVTDFRLSFFWSKSKAPPIREETRSHNPMFIDTGSDNFYVDDHMLSAWLPNLMTRHSRTVHLYDIETYIRDRRPPSIRSSLLHCLKAFFGLFKLRHGDPFRLRHSVNELFADCFARESSFRRRGEGLPSTLSLCNYPLRYKVV